MADNSPHIGAWQEDQPHQGAWQGELVESDILPIELTGTAITGGVTETEIKDGSETIIMTIDGDTFVSGTTSEDAIVAGLNGSASWNSEVRDNLDNTNIVLSVGDTVATITLPAAPGYSISANDTVIATIPAASLTTTTEDTIATPNIIVTNESEGIVIFRRRIEHAA